MSKVHKLILILIFIMLMITTLIILFNTDKKNNQYVLVVNEEKINPTNFIAYSKIIKNEIEEEVIEVKGNDAAKDIWSGELYGIPANKYLVDKITEKLIYHEICSEKFSELGLELSDNDIGEIFQKINLDTEQRKMFKIGITKEEYMNYLEKEEKALLLSDYLTENVIILDNEVKNYASKLNNPSIYVLKRMIFSTRDKNTLAELYSEDDKKKIYAKAQDVLAKLKNGESFDTLAIQYSDNTLKYKAGDEFKVVQGTSDNKKIEEVASNLEIGKYSDIFDSTQGYEIIILEKVITKDSKDYIAEMKKMMIDTKKKDVFSKEYEKWKRLSYINTNTQVINNLNIK